jgi:uncharacterized protein YoxC
MMMFAQAPTLNEISNAMAKHDYTLAGFLVVAAIAVAIGFALLLWWIGHNVVIPTRDRAFRHLDRVDETMSGLNETIKTIPARMDRVENKLDDVGNRVEHIERIVAK